MAFARFPLFRDQLYDNPNQYFPNKFYLTVEAGNLMVGPAPKVSFWSKVGKFFTFKQDKNLLEVNLKFQELAQNFWRQDTAEFRAAYEKLSDGTDTSKEVALMHEFAKIESKFKRANSKKPLTLVALKIVNFFRSILGMKKIEFKKYLLIPTIPCFSAMKSVVNTLYDKQPPQDISTCPHIRTYLQTELAKLTP